MSSENNVALEPKKKSKIGLIIALIAGALGVFFIALVVLLIVLFSGGYKGALRKYFRAAERGNGIKLEQMRVPVDRELPELQMNRIEDFDWEIVRVERLSKRSKPNADPTASAEYFGRGLENMYGGFGFEGDKVRAVYIVKVELEGEVAGADREGTFTYYVYKYGTKWYVWDGNRTPEYALITQGQDN